MSFQDGYVMELLFPLGRPSPLPARCSFFSNASNMGRLLARLHRRSHPSGQRRDPFRPVVGYFKARCFFLSCPDGSSFSSAQRARLVPRRGASEGAPLDAGQWRFARRSPFPPRRRRAPPALSHLPKSPQGSGKPFGEWRQADFPRGSQPGDRFFFSRQQVTIADVESLGGSGALPLDRAASVPFRRLIFLPGP